MRYRIKEEIRKKGSCFQIQYKFLFWWYYLESYPSPDCVNIFLSLEKAQIKLKELRNKKVFDIKYHYS